MKSSRQFAYLVSQVLAIALVLMYVWSFAADLVTEKEDVANVVGFAIYIAVIASAIIGGTWYTKKFIAIFTEKETPNAPKPE